MIWFSLISLGRTIMLHIPLREKTTLLLLFIIMPNPKFLTRSHIVSWIARLKASLKWLSQSSWKPDLWIKWRIKTLNWEQKSIENPWKDWHSGEYADSRLARWGGERLDEMQVEDSAHYFHSLSLNKVSYGNAVWIWWLYDSLWSF